MKNVKSIVLYVLLISSLLAVALWDWVDTVPFIEGVLLTTLLLSAFEIGRMETKRITSVKKK